MRRRHRNNESALTNFALTFAKAMLALALMIFLLVNPIPKKDDGVKPKIEYLITMDWPVNLDYDMDLWMRDPDGKLVSYGHKEEGFLTLERDDMGSATNTVVINGRSVVKLTNEEVISIRGFKPGEYVINVHLYSANFRVNYGDPVPPFPVTVRIQKMNPSVTDVFQGTVTMTYLRQEQHVIRFTMHEDGTITDLNNDLPVMIRDAPDPGRNTTNH